MSLIDLGKDLYTECCVRHGVKPNAVIADQLDRPDLLNLHNLDATDTFLGAKGVLAVLDVVRQHRCLRALRLPKNGVEDSGIEALCDVINSGHPCLSLVDVSDNPLSTRSGRVLCETVRRCGRPTQISTEGCGLVPEWEARLQRSLSANIEMEAKGFYARGPPRQPGRWHTSFVLVMGDETLTRQYCTRVLPAVASYVSRYRVRIAPVSVRAADAPEQVQAKVQRCRESQNAGLTWCVVLLDGNAFGAAALKGAQLSALETVLATPSPVVPPLRNKLGAVRPPVYHTARSLFVYVEVSVEERMKRGTEALAPADWLPLAGFPAQTTEALVAMNDTLATTTAAVVTLGAAASVRYQGDLLSSLTVVFREDEEGGGGVGALSALPTTATSDDMTLTAAGDEVHCAARLLLTDTREMEAAEAPNGALHEKKSAVLMHYLLDNVKSMNVPFVLYGAADIGKGELLSCAAEELRMHHSVRPSTKPLTAISAAASPNSVFSTAPAASAATSAAAELYHRVDCVRVGGDDNSITMLLYRLLALFCVPSSSTEATNATASDALMREFTSLSQLSEAVREAIRNYKGPRMAVLLSRLDEVDTCGFTSDVLADWLPHSFPGALSVVVSITTECPALPLLRRRSPQPYECLVPPLSELNRVNLFKRYLAEKGVHLPGVEDRRYTRRDELKAAENAFLAKESCVSFLYIRLAAVYLHYLTRTTLTLDNEYASLDAVEHELPPTTDDVVERLCHKLETFNDPLTLRYVLLCLCVTSLAVTDLQVLCEELGPCEKGTTLPALLQLHDVELVTWNAEGILSVAHHTVRNVFLQLYAADLDRVSVLVENHFTRMLNTRSAEIGVAFRHLVPLLMRNGSFQHANQLLLDPTVADFVIATNAVNRYYIMDGYIRLLQARDVLVELAAMDTDGLYSERDIDDDALRRSLRDVQRCPGGNLLQTSLLHRSATPFSAAAHKLVSTSLEQLPYPVLLPTNDGDEDINSATWNCCQTSGTSIVQCNGRGDYLVVTTEDTVITFHVGTGTELARLHMPFENDQPITGALMATGTRVVVVGTEQILIWDFEGRSFFLFGEMTTTAHVSFMDAFGTTLIARHVTTGVLCVLDVTRKMVVRDIPHIANEPVRNAIFCGSCVLVMSTDQLFLFDSCMSDYTTLTHTDGTVRSVACNADGRLIASTVASTLYIWTARGDLLHRIEVGDSPITGLHFDAAGTLLLTRQAEGSKLWKTLTGTCVTTLTNPLNEEEVNYTTFTHDSTRLLGRSGNRLIVWEAQNCTPLGVYTAPTGVYTYIHEVHNELFCATSTGILKRYKLQDVIPSVESSRAGALSTDWRQNAKIAEYAIEQVCVGASEYVAALDARRRVHVYHRTTGKRVAHSIADARTIALFGPQTVVSVPQKTLCLSLFDLATLDERRCSLPRDVLSDCAMTLFVAPASENAWIGLTTSVPGHSSLILFDAAACALVCSFAMHAGRPLHTFFLGSFVYSASADGGFAVWNLPRRAQRASYQHATGFIAATSTTAHGLLFTLDTEGRFLQAHVDKLTSPSRAQFVVQSIAVPQLTRHVRAHSVSAMHWCGSHLLLISQSGSVVVASREGVRRLNDVHLRSAATCAQPLGTENAIPNSTNITNTTNSRGEVEVLTGHCDGRVLAHRLLVPRYKRPDLI